MLQATLKIAEIGHTGVGKTTYMATMYSEMQTPIEGFSLKAIKDSDHRRLLQLGQAVQNGHYPNATDQRSEYKFYLQYKNKNVLNFNWSDYRGGALLEAQSDSQAKSLMQDLCQADGILMFCDLQALYQRNLRRNQLGRMISLVSTAMGKELDHPVALAIVLTKADLVPTFDESILAPLNGLIEAIKSNENMVGCLVPVACGYKPYNVELPLLNTLYVGVSVKIQQLLAKIDYNLERYEYYQQQASGFWGGILEVWDTMLGEQTNSEKADEQLKQARKKQEEYQKILDSAQALEQYLKRLSE